MFNVERHQISKHEVQVLGLQMRQQIIPTVFETTSPQLIKVLKVETTSPPKKKGGNSEGVKHHGLPSVAFAERN
jgi:hypothetical protein